MEGKGKKSWGQSVQFLFTMLLFFILTLCALFTISFGAKVYKNIETRMNENFAETTVLFYVSNKVKQADVSDAISIVKIENTEVLKIEEKINDNGYTTLIYSKNGSIRELFFNSDSSFALDDGIPIMDGGDLYFALVEKNLLEVKTSGERGSSILLALRSEGNQDE